MGPGPAGSPPPLPTTEVELCRSGNELVDNFQQLVAPVCIESILSQHCPHDVALDRSPRNPAPISGALMPIRHLLVRIDRHSVSVPRSPKPSSLPVYSGHCFENRLLGRIVAFYGWRVAALVQHHASNVTKLS